MMNNENQRSAQMGSSGLTRYCSAPSSYLVSLLGSPRKDSPYESDDLAELFAPPPPRKTEPPLPQMIPRENSFWGSEVESSGSGSSGLIRYSSSPAGLLADINLENELGHLRGIGTFPTGTGGNRFSWEDSNSNSLLLSDDFLNGFLDDDNQGSESGTLPRHLSFPKESFEKLLQDSVPCKIRARRGCATHPRSIAERVRRTKISERMRKLQELVPNMDKQTNTCDMLELAVDYIKDLQTQVKSLCEDRDKCSCSARISYRS